MTQERKEELAQAVANLITECYSGDMEGCCPSTNNMLRAMDEECTLTEKEWEALLKDDSPLLDKILTLSEQMA